ncbi:MAG: 6-pyruvoyl-tetrahydropterin synthase-related protein [Candidatus Gottesmanbacteria bacterium]
MKKSLFNVVKIIFTLFSSICITIVCYLFGWPLLEGSLKGNDIGFYLSIADWVSKNLPSVPQWYPFVGGGVSILQATQIGAYITTAIVSLLSSLTLIQSIRVIELASIVIISLELYFFVWYFFKNQVAALIAGIFFPLSQAVWSLVMEIGMVPQILSLIFVLPLFAFFELFLERKRGYYLCLSVISFALAVFNHLITGALLVETLFLYSLFRTIVNFRKPIKFQLIFNFSSALIITILGFILLSFWLIPYVRYLSIASRNTVASPSFEQLGYINLIHLFGFDTSIDPKLPNIMWEAFLALPVLVLAGLGIILAFLKKQKQLIIISLISIFFLLYSALPGLEPSLVKLFMISFVTATYQRAFLIPMILLPILAAWACVAIAQVIVFPIRRLTISKIVSPLLIIMVAGGAIYFLARSPSYYDTKCYFGLGAGNVKEIDYCNLLQKLNNINPISNLGTPWDQVTSHIAQGINDNGNNRIDLSPRLGPVIMNWTRYSKTPIVSLYAFWAGINNIFTGYYTGSLYGKELDFSTPEDVRNVTSWFGIEKILLLNNTDSEDRFSSDYWQTGGNMEDNMIKILNFKNPTGPLTVSSKPKILFIGKFKNRAYEQFFRLACAGAYPYGKAMFIEGKDSGRIDDYTLEELKRFEMIFLYGYGYKNKDKAFSMLEQYVKNGGRVFIDTGWQYISADWKTANTPIIFPVESLSWETFSSWDLEGFSPPLYQGQPWGISVGLKIRDWAQPRKIVNGKLAIAEGNYGKGKIIWSGINLVGHAFTYKNWTEYNLLTNIIDDLLTDFKGEDKNDEVKFTRVSADKIIFTFTSPQTNTYLFWRENWHPDWEATLNQAQGQKNIPLYRAGPNFMLIPADNINTSDKLTLTLKQPWLYKIAKIISIFTLLLLLIISINDKIVLRIRDIITSKFHYHIGGWWNKD